MGFGLRLGAAALAAVIAAAAPPAAALELTCRTVRLIVPWGAGGDSDAIFRALAEAANRAGAKPEIAVRNIPGERGVRGVREAARAEPDGCTLLAVHQSLVVSHLAGRLDFAWDSLSPVAMVAAQPFVIGAHPSVPFDDIRGLLATARAAPGTIAAAYPPDMPGHFAFLLLEEVGRAPLRHMPFPRVEDRMTALLGGTAAIGEISVASAERYAASKELKVLGIAAETRHPGLPKVATLREQGVELVVGTDRGVMLPGGAAKEVVDHYAGLVGKAVQDPGFARQIAPRGALVRHLGPADYAAYFKEIAVRWGQAADKAGLRKGG